MLNVSPVSTPVVPDPQPAGLIFLSSTPGPLSPQTIQVLASSKTPLPFQASANTTDASGWLSITPGTGSAVAGTPASISVSVDSTGLKPGVYRGTVSLASGPAVRTVNLTLVVETAVTPSSISRLHPDLWPLRGAELVVTQTARVIFLRRFFMAVIRRSPSLLSIPAARCWAMARLSPPSRTAIRPFSSPWWMPPTVLPLRPLRSVCSSCWPRVGPAGQWAKTIDTRVLRRVVRLPEKRDDLLHFVDGSAVRCDQTTVTGPGGAATPFANQAGGNFFPVAFSAVRLSRRMEHMWLCSRT